MRILVSGGAGQIGSHLCWALVERGHDVICVDNLLTGKMVNVEGLRSNDRFTFRQEDVTAPLDGFAPLDAIYHLASPASPPEYVTVPLETLAVNSVGTWNLLRLAEAHRARFLFASTSEVYGDPEVHPQREDYWGNVNPNGVRSCYDESKRFGEALTAAHVRLGKVDGRIVRIFNTYGPHCRPDDGRMIPNFICQALRGQPLTIYGSGHQTRSICFVSDTVRGLRLALESNLAPGEVVNIGNPEEHTVEEYAREISAVCGVEYRAVYLETPADDPKRRCPDIAKARSLLGWEPEVPMDQGLARTAHWFRPILAPSQGMDEATPEKAEV